jgi:hypothetical protein
MMAPMQDPRFRGDDKKMGGGDDKHLGFVGQTRMALWDSRIDTHGAMLRMTINKQQADMQAANETTSLGD